MARAAVMFHDYSQKLRHGDGWFFLHSIANSEYVLAIVQRPVPTFHVFVANQMCTVTK